MRFVIFIVIITIVSGSLWFSLQGSGDKQPLLSPPDKYSDQAINVRPSAHTDFSSSQNFHSSEDLSGKKTTQTQSLSRARLVEEIYELNISDYEQAARLLENSTLEERQALTLSLIKNWSSFDPVAAMEWLKQQEQKISDSEYAIGMRALFKNYARVDPQAAFSEIETFDDTNLRNELIFDVATAWATDDPDAAMNWVTSLNPMDAEYKESALEGVLESYIQAKPEEAALVFQNLESQTLQTQLAPLVAEKLSQKNLSEGINWLKGLQNVDIYQAGLASIAMSALNSNRSSEEVMDVLLFEPSLYDNEPHQLTEALNSLANASPETVRSRFEHIPDTVRPEITTALSQSWLRHEASLSNYKTWLLGLPKGDGRDAGVLVLAQNDMQQDPDTALHWAQELSDSSKRLEVIREIIESSPTSKLSDISGLLPSLNLPREQYIALEAILLKRL